MGAILDVLSLGYAFTSHQKENTLLIAHTAPLCEQAQAFPEQSRHTSAFNTCLLPVLSARSINYRCS